ncbi:MAG: Ig-like domain-containing protein [Bacilli bacterium]|nr:Ig-like domain-containing protein [Bacilli bacterium]
MKNKKYVYGMSLALILALASCGQGGTTSGATSTPESKGGSEPTSTPTSVPTSEEEESDVSGGTFIDHSKSFKNALLKDYSNMTVYCYQEYGEFAEENYIYYVDDYQIVYDVVSGSYLYYHDYGDSNYLYFSPEVHGYTEDKKPIYGPEAWLDKGYMDAPLSIWNTYFHMPTLLDNITDEDVYFVSGYYVVKTQAIIDRLMNTGFQFLWFNNPTYMWFGLDSNGYINNIVGVDNPERDDSPVFQLKFLYIGSTTFYQGQLPPAPNEQNVIPYWQYKGWDGPFEYKYPTALNIAHVKTGKDGYDTVLDIEDYDPVTYTVDPEDYNTFEYPTWHTTDPNVAIVDYPVRDSRTKSIMAVGTGVCEIYATIPGENDTVIESNHIKVKVNAEKEQHLDGMVYDFSFVDFDKETGVVTADNEAGNTPFEITGNKLLINDGKNSDYIFNKGEKAVIMNAGVMGEGQPEITFNFGDQQVSSLSFKYGFFWDDDFQNLDFLSEAAIETSNDGVNWESIDILQEIKDNISYKYLKLMEKEFAPASMVRIRTSSNFIGRACRLSFAKIAFMANEDCHKHGQVDVVPTTGIKLTVDETEIYIGDTAKATATVMPADATNKNVTFTSSNEEVATIDENGNIVALKEGMTTIQATQGEIVSNTKTIKVVARPTIDAQYVGKWISEDFKGSIEIKAEDLSKAYVTLDESAGATKTSFVLDLVEIDGRTHNFEDEEGNTLCINFGSDTTLFKSGTNLGGYVPSLNQVELEKYVASTDISITAPATTLYLGSSNVALTKTMLTAKVNPTGATASNVTWTTNNNTVATVEANGNYLNVTAKAVGTVTITATNSEGKTASVTITVAEPVVTENIAIVGADGKAIPGDAIELDTGAQAKLSALIDEAATERDVQWTSSDSTIASVSSNGTVSAVKAGTVTITATSHGVSAFITVTVKGTAAIFCAGTWTGSDYNGTELTWTVSSDGTTATLSFTDWDDEDHEYSFTFSGVSADGHYYLFTYDEDETVVAKMYAHSWSASTTNCDLVLDDENWVINDMYTLFIDDNGAPMSK